MTLSQTAIAIYVASSDTFERINKQAWARRLFTTKTGQPLRLKSVTLSHCLCCGTVTERINPLPVYFDALPSDLQYVRTSTVRSCEACQEKLDELTKAELIAKLIEASNAGYLPSDNG